MSNNREQFRLFKDIETNEVYKVPNTKLSIERTEGLYDLRYKYKVSSNYEKETMYITYNNKSQMVRVRRNFVHDNGGCLTSLINNVSTNSDFYEFGVMFRNLEYSTNISDVSRLVILSNGSVLDELPNIYGGGSICWGNYSLPRDRDIKLASNYYFNMGFNNDLRSEITVRGNMFDLIERQIVLRHSQDAFNRIVDVFGYRREKTLNLTSIQALLIAHISGVYVDDILKGRRVA